MNVNDVVKIQQIIGSAELLKHCNTCSLNTGKSFMNVMYEQYEVEMEPEASAGLSEEEFNELWEKYKADSDVKSFMEEEDSVISDKQEEETAWKKFVAMQTKKRKMLEEILIKRRLTELQRIATGGGKFGEDALPYFQGVSAADLLSGLM